MTPFKAIIGLIVVAFATTVVFHPTREAWATERQRLIVEIHKFKFVPGTLVVRAGDIVVWRNKDIVPHTVTSKDASWDSGTIEAGREWEAVITRSMTLGYFCEFHPSMVAGLAVSAQ